MSKQIPTPPPTLDPPFRGYIETTFDSLLVFEAARRGMIPRVTRRLIERERGMVQSGAVFVFDEHESGIKRWTDGLIWSPSRILGNFLVYRETDNKKTGGPSTPMAVSSSHPPSTSPSRLSPGGNPHQPQVNYDTLHSTPPSMQAPHMGQSTHGPPLGQGQLQRPRSASEGGSGIDRQRERQLVGSLTNSYKFKDGGLVKKTMSVTVNGFSQHMISYYSLEDVMAGKLRTPSTIPELASLEISPEYLHKQNFRFPPMIEVGHDGVPRYRGEPEEPTSPNASLPISTPTFVETYEYSTGSRMDTPPSQPRNRSVTVPMPIPTSAPGSAPAASYMAPGSAGSGYAEHRQMVQAQPLVRQGSSSSIQSASVMRPGSSSRRYEAYPQGSPRLASLQMQQAAHRRQSTSQDYYQYDVKPNSYHYQPPATAPGSFGEYYSPGPMPSPLQNDPPQHNYAQHHSYPSQWANHPPARLLPSADYNNPPSSAGSSGSGGLIQNQGGPPGSSHGHPMTPHTISEDHRSQQSQWSSHPPQPPPPSHHAQMTPMAMAQQNWESGQAGYPGEGEWRGTVA